MDSVIKTKNFKSGIIAFFYGPPQIFCGGEEVELKTKPEIGPKKDCYLYVYTNSFARSGIFYKINLHHWLLHCVCICKQRVRNFLKKYCRNTDTKLNTDTITINDRNPFPLIFNCTQYAQIHTNLPWLRQLSHTHVHSHIHFNIKRNSLPFGWLLLYIQFVLSYFDAVYYFFFVCVTNACVHLRTLCFALT